MKFYLSLYYFGFKPKYTTQNIKLNSFKKLRIKLKMETKSDPLSRLAKCEDLKLKTRTVKKKVYLDLIYNVKKVTARIFTMDRRDHLKSKTTINLF